MENQIQQILMEAREAAAQAGGACVPRPVLVGTPKNMMASLMGEDDGGLDESKPIYYVNGGLCGFAWIKIRPARGKFVTWLKREGIGWLDSYEGGWRISSYDIYRAEGELWQSVEVKEAAVEAAARVLREYGINAQVGSRLD